MEIKFFSFLENINDDFFKIYKVNKCKKLFFGQHTYKKRNFQKRNF